MINIRLILFTLLIVAGSTAWSAPIIIGKDQAPINKQDYETLKAIAKHAGLPIDEFSHYEEDHYIVGPEGMLYWDIDKNGIIDGEDSKAQNGVSKWSNSYITDKNGNVIAINVHKSDFSDTTLLNKLKSLVALKLFMNKVKEIDLYDLPELRHIYIFDDKATAKLIKLKNINKLAYLDIFGLDMPDFKRLSGVDHLHKVVFEGGVTLENFAGLENLPNLKYLHVNISGENTPEKFTTIKGIPKNHGLERLKLSTAYATDLSPLKNFSKLKHLELWATHKELKDYTPISTLKNLEFFEITARTPRDFTFLKDMPKLKSTLSYHTPFTSLKGLEEAPNLESLVLKQGVLPKLAHLENNPNLKVIKIDGHKIKKIEGLSNLKKLKELGLLGNQIKKIEGLDNNLCLEDVRLTGNPISEFENIFHLPLLYTLDISDTKIRNFPNWEKLQRLGRLGVDKSQLDPEIFSKEPFFSTYVPIKEFDKKISDSPKITDEERKKYGCI